MCPPSKRFKSNNHREQDEGSSDETEMPRDGNDGSVIIPVNDSVGTTALDAAIHAVRILIETTNPEDQRLVLQHQLRLLLVEKLYQMACVCFTNFTQNTNHQPANRIELPMGIYMDIPINNVGLFTISAYIVTLMNEISESDEERRRILRPQLQYLIARKNYIRFCLDQGKQN